MKRIILSILAVVAIAVSVVAQSLSLSTLAGVPIANNAEYLVGGDYQSTITSYVAVQNSSAVDQNVMCKKTEISVMGGTSNYFCWGACYLPSTFISLEPMMILAGVNDLNSFSGDFDPASHMGESVVRYTFYLVNNPNDSVCVNVRYLAGYAGIAPTSEDQFRISEAYPNPATANVSFSYTLPSAVSSATFVVRNLLGSEVKSFNLDEAQGKLNFSVTDLQAGVYFYSVVMNNSTMLTRKLVVK